MYLFHEVMGQEGRIVTKGTNGLEKGWRGVRRESSQVNKRAGTVGNKVR